MTLFSIAGRVNFFQLARVACECVLVYFGYFLIKIAVVKILRWPVIKTHAPSNFDLGMSSCYVLKSTVCISSLTGHHFRVIYNLSITMRARLLDRLPYLANQTTPCFCVRMYLLAFFLLFCCSCDGRE